ncbi:hypothetical protein [Streptomyces sp. NPDC088789]|uniref:hypothetical protein n=1 Tax=Streptomyces sp. NPDC088789 TaxID=3365899 RepID=UPI00380CAD28
MHRTTTATLLVTVAVTALAGCTTVQRPDGPTATATPAPPPLPKPDGNTGPQIVQAPAREALEMIGPARSPEAEPPPPDRRAATAPSARPAPRPAVPRGEPRPRADRAEPPRPHRPAPPQDLADAIGKDVRERTDVCALGQQYGGWREGSPEARICERTYGR